MRSNDLVAFGRMKTLFFLSCFAFLSCFVSIAAAQNSPQPVVKEIIIKSIGVGRIDESFVLTQVRTKVGDKLDGIRVSGDLKYILDTGRFSEAFVEAESSGSGVRLIFSIRNKYKLAKPVIVEGADHFRESKILKFLDLQQGDLFDEHVLGTRGQLVRKEYLLDNFREISVEWETDVVDEAEGLATAKIRIKEGDKSRIKKVEFIGNDQFSRKTLFNAVKKTSGWNPFKWLVKLKGDSESLEEARLNIRNYYTEKGFLDVRVDGPVVEEYGKNKLVAKFSIEEGVSYRFGEISVSGATIFPEPELMRYVKTRTGDVAAGQAIGRSIQVIRDYYGSRGYVNSMVRPIMDPDVDKKTLDVRFAVTEGALVKINNVLIKGNTRTKDKVIRRELLVYPGDIYDEVKIRRSERRVNNLGFFSSVRSYPLSTEKEGERDLVLDVQEKRTGQFMMGAGFSSIDSFMGFVELSQGNFDISGWPFTGGGQKLKLRAQLGTTRQSYELSFIEPWFLDRKLSFGFDLYHTEVSYSEYDIDRLGGAVSIGKSLPGPNRIDFRYKLEESNVSDVSDEDEYFHAETGESFYFTRDEEKIESSLRVSVSHNTTDNPFIPTRGTRASVFGEMSGGPLSFDTDIYRAGGRLSQYVPLWWGHVLNLQLRGEVVEEYGDTEEVPITERLFLGGPGSLRGYDYRDVGPKAIRYTGDEIVYKPIGGRTLALGKAEYIVPIVQGVRCAAFYDIGNVWEESFDFDFNEYASSVGLGLRIDIPGFPIRFDWAWALDSDDELTEEEVFSFWIGFD